MAVVVPVVMLFFAMLFESCRVLMLQHTADSAAYEAARAAMVPGATAAEAQQVAIDMVDAAGLTSSDVQVTPSNLTDETPIISVRVDIPVDDNSWIVPQFIANIDVSSEVTLVCERSPLVRRIAIDALANKKDELAGH